jgi:high-affinity nickel-transport protein
MIHGVGAETPSQVALFTAAAGVTGALGGLPILLSFVAGLFLGNSLLVVSAAGLSSGRRLPSIYFVVAVASAIVSLVVGSIYLFG